ncbi:ribonuclease-like [Trachemys scripta elegans]|uniref:ribonuclease-like n=1 Tax=Trachemys scripta elegans TaxID=31138 RepID=UPI001554F710|nr:ribonuclease-like [Trachemys scripta elegans]XP_034643957.1 ribonuclease-like [Trachemys scripta elegans]
MALKGPCPALLLPLALLVACLALSSGDPWNPLNDIFRRQHVNNPKNEAINNKVYCNMMMWDRGIFWKYTNTFIHAPLNNINAVCKADGIPVGGFKRKSKKEFTITTCTFNFGTFSFNGLNGKNKIVLACLNGLPVKFVRHI